MFGGILSVVTKTEFAKTIAARARARTQMLALEGRRPTSRRDHVGETLERRIEGALRAARVSGRSTFGAQVPKT
jgi:hypothetical protein